MLFTYSTVIHCSPLHLWTFLEEPEKQKQWMKGLLENQLTSPPPAQAGSTFRLRILEGGKPADYDGIIVAREEGKHLGIRFWGGCFPPGMVMHVDYRLTEVDKGTRLDYEARAECGKISWFMWLMLPLIRLFGRMQMRSFMKTLTRLAEAPSAASAKVG